MAMAVAMQRAWLVGALIRGPEWYSSIAACSMPSAERVEDDGPSPSCRLAVGALIAILGAGALYTFCQHTINLEPAAEESAPKMDLRKSALIFGEALNSKEFVKFKVAEVHDVNLNTQVYREQHKAWARRSSVRKQVAQETSFLQS